MSLQTVPEHDHYVPGVAISSPGAPSEHEMMVYGAVAKYAVQSKMYQDKGGEAGVMMIMLAARELGIPPMQALNGGINLINGKAEISARMMGALIRKAGHDFKIVETSDSICTIVGKRGDNGQSEQVTFSFAEAQKAGLVKAGGGWSKWPKDMCFARALSRLARQLFSDVIGIGYVEGEIKPTSAIVMLPDEPVEKEDEEVLFEKFLNLFSEAEKVFATEYLKVVQEHFEWTQLKALKELLKDEKKTVDKFLVWKNKREK